MPNSMDHGPLTDRQEEIRSFIAEQARSRGFPPTVRELAARFSLSIGAVQGHLSALEKKGALRRAPERARGLTLTVDANARQVRLPILGRVAAGVPIEAVPHVEDFLEVDEAIAKRANFVLRVKGDSMEPELHEKDMVLVRLTETAQNGELVVAYVDGHEATVKRYRHNGRHAWLEPANPAYSVIRGPFTIAGVVTSLIRTFF